MEIGCSKSHGRFTALVLVTVLPWLLVIFMAVDSRAYGVYMDDSLIGYVRNKDDAYRISDELAAECEDEPGISELKHITFKKVFADSSAIDVYDTLKANMLKKANHEIECYNLKINDEVIGLIADKQSADNIVKEVADYYIEKNGIKNDEESKALLKNKITIEETTARASDIPQEEKLSSEIISANEAGENCLSIEISGKKTEIQEIPAPVVINSSSDLSLGEEKVISEGAPGTKEVTLAVTFINDKAVSKKVLSDITIKNPENKVVMRGTKNPINGDVAFLYAPSRGVITSGFGMRWGKQHNGIDIAANMGDPVKAALEGTVSYSGWMDGYGYLVRLNHGDNIETYYGHCSKLNCKVGDKVSQGDVIAYAGSTGRSTGPHVHFEVRSDGKPVDPTKYIIK